MSEALGLFDTTLRGALIALLLLTATVLLRDRPRLAAARACVAMCLGLCLQVVGSTPWLEARLPLIWQLPLVMVSVANAVLFWVLVQALFDDEFVFRPVHAAAWVAVASLSGLNCWLSPNSTWAWAPFSWGAQRAVPLLFAGLAGVAVVAHWRADLVEGRRRVRTFIAVTGIVYTVGMLAARLASPDGRLSATTATVDVALLLAMVVPAAWHMLGLSALDLFPATRPTSAAPAASVGAAMPGTAALPGKPLPPQDAGEERLAAALQRLMHEARAYRDEDLTVAALAARLAVPEYRLRRHINQRLGHRNFNAYVNGLRLEEICAALADPLRRDVPVLTLALDAGFQSIGPFNRAFKTVTGVTPTEFRRAKLADS